MSLDEERQLYFDPKTISLRGYYQCHELSIPGVQMLGRYNHLRARAPLSPHRHKHHVEISLLVSGRQSYRVDGKVYRMKGGEQFVTFPNEVHDTAEDPEEKGMMFWLILETTCIQKNWLFLTPYAACALIKKLDAISNRHFYANPRSHLTLDRIFQLLHQPVTRFRNFEVGHELTNYLFQTIEAARVGAIPEISPRIQSTLEYIAHREEEEWIDLPVLARQSGLSEPRFKARFRHEMGIPPGQYMVRRKLELAKQRLATMNRVTEVAYDLGFSSSQYFATVFKKYTQQTPSQFIASLSNPKHHWPRRLE